MKKVLCLLILIISTIILGCGGISEKDLPEKSKEYVIELGKTSGYLKIEGFDYAPRYKSALDNAEKLINRLKPEPKEYLFNQVLELKDFEGLNPVQIPSPQYKTIMVPMTTYGYTYIKKYPEKKTNYNGMYTVVWQEINDKWVVYDVLIGSNQKSHMDILEELPLTIVDRVNKNVYIEEKTAKMRY